MNNTLAPISRLSDDVLSMIFEVHRDRIPGEWTWLYGERQERLPVQQFVISRVCKRWQRVAYETASLWTMYDICDESDLAILERSLPRSKNALLDVRVLCFAVVGGEVSVRNRAISFLKENMHRIYKLALEGCMHLVFGLFRYSLPTANLLTELDVYEGRDGCDTAFTDIPTAWHDVHPLRCPQLRSLQAHDFAFAAQCVDTRRPTRIVFNCRDSHIQRQSVVLAVLRSLPGLVHATFAFGELQADNANSTTEAIVPVHLHQLETLDVDFSFCEVSMELLLSTLKLLNTPTLRCLHLHGSPGNGEEIALSLLGFLDNLHALEELSVEIHWTVAVALLDRMAQVGPTSQGGTLRSLRSLAITCRGYDDNDDYIRHTPHLSPQIRVWESTRRMVEGRGGSVSTGFPNAAILEELYIDPTLPEDIAAAVNVLGVRVMPTYSFISFLH